MDNFLPDYKSYDIIKGYRADDSYFSYARDFISNTLSLEDLKQAMMLGKLQEDFLACFLPKRNLCHRSYQRRNKEWRHTHIMKHIFRMPWRILP